MRKSVIFGCVIIGIFLVTAGCQPVLAPLPVEQPAGASPVPVQPTDTPQPEPTQAPSATATLLPTETLLPTNTPTATIEPTATPEYLIFRDDFNGSVRPEWTWENENPERWTFSPDGWLQIIGEDPGLFTEERSNVLWVDLPDSPFAIIVHLKAAPSDNYAQATIFMYENLDNFVEINRGFCSVCSTGGNGVYMEYKINAQGDFYAIPFTETDLYLKLEDKDGVLSGYYGTEPDQWKRIGRFGNYFKFKRVGLGVTNADNAHNFNNDLVGLFDYFEIRKP
jgi:hypothetical protein